MSNKKTEVYTSLAKIYDEIMKDVDYEDWADFIDAIIQEHHPEAISLLELACGTGKVAMYLEELDCYDITASDKSAEMLEIGKSIATFRGMSIIWKQIDFLDINLNETFDVVFILFDTVNYLLKEEDILAMLSNVRKVMNDDAILIFDFTTQKHSEYVEKLLSSEGITPDNVRYERNSYYMPTEKLHINEFEIEQLDEDKTTVLSREKEVHRQRVYEFDEMKAIIEKSDFEIIATYEDFDLINANSNSERITMVLA